MLATYCLNDNKLRLYPDVRLDEETYKAVKEAGFKWAPKQGCFVAPQWTPRAEDLLLCLTGEIDDEDMTPEERAQQRAERFEGYSEKRAADAERAYAEVQRISDNIPFGQPILVGHHSEKRARKDAERIENGMRKTIKFFETSEYWERRAKASLNHVKYKERHDVRHRRMKGLEADARKYQREIDGANKAIKAFNEPELNEKKAVALLNYAVGLFGSSLGHNFVDSYKDQTLKIALPDLKTEIVTSQEKRVAYYTRWLNHANNRIAYEKIMLDGWEPPKVERKKPDLAPLVNFETEGCIRMTAAEWKASSKYDVYQVIAFNIGGGRAGWQKKGDYRRRTKVNFLGKDDQPVFITDMPVKYPVGPEVAAHA